MKKRIIFVFACLWLIISFFIIKYTYAKYLSSIDSNSNISIDGWKIILNNQDIMQNSDFSQNLELVFPGNDYSRENCIVPGAVGYFDLNIDSSNVFLPFRFTVTLDVPEENEINDVKIIGYSYPGKIDYITYTDDSSNSINSSCARDVDSLLIRIYVSWDDDENTRHFK